MKKFVLQLRNRDIVLSFQKKIKVRIGDLNIFPSGFERLRLWDSSIILARYVLKNKNLFNGREVL